MDSSSSSSSSSLVVDILYRLDKLHVAASVYGNGIERSVLYNSILLYCFIYMYIYNVYRFSFCLFILFLYIYFLFCGERERERTLAMTNVNGKNLICLESIFWTIYKFGLVFLIFDSLRNHKNQNKRLQVKLYRKTKRN